MTDDALSRRTMLGVVAAATSGCVGRVLDRPSVALTGVRLHNWTNYRTPVLVALFREGEFVLDEQVSLAPLREPGSAASVAPTWPVETARYRIPLEAADGDATLDRRLPPSGFAWDGCAYVDLENGHVPDRTVDPDAEKWFETRLQEVVEPGDFSSEYCPGQ